MIRLVACSTRSQPQTTEHSIELLHLRGDVLRLSRRVSDIQTWLLVLCLLPLAPLPHNGRIVAQWVSQQQKLHRLQRHYLSTSSVACLGGLNRTQLYKDGPAAQRSPCGSAGSLLDGYGGPRSGRLDGSAPICHGSGPSRSGVTVPKVG